MRKVLFQQNFHVPGYPRSRFTKGEVIEVPDDITLPKTAKVLPDNYVEPAGGLSVADARKLADTGRATAESTGADAIKAAGMGGYQDVSGNEQKALEESIRADEAEARADALEAKLQELLDHMAEADEEPEPGEDVDKDEDTLEDEPAPKPEPAPSPRAGSRRASTKK